MSNSKWKRVIWLKWASKWNSFVANAPDGRIRHVDENNNEIGTKRKSQFGVNFRNISHTFLINSFKTENKSIYKCSSARGSCQEIRALNWNQRRISPFHFKKSHNNLFNVTKFQSSIVWKTVFCFNPNWKSPTKIKKQVKSWHNCCNNCLFK